MGCDGSSVDDEGTVTATTVAAISTVGEERGGEDRETRFGIEIARIPFHNCRCVEGGDLGESLVPRRKPPRVWSLEVLVAERRHNSQRYRLGVVDKPVGMTSVA
jgi:hypothetical protein